LRIQAVLQQAEASGSVPAGAFARYVNKFKQGMSLVSAYTGQASAEQAVEYMSVALEHSGSFDPKEHHGIKTAQACDIKPMCHRVLNSFPEHCRPEHIFGDLVARLPPALVRQIDELKPTRAEYAEHPDVVASAHEAITALIKNNLHGCFEEGCERYCFRHKGMCKMYEHEARKGDDGKPRPRVFLAGVSCLDSTKAGLRRGNLGPGFIPLIVFLAERRVRQEDMGVIECTTEFDEQLVMEWLSDLYDIHSLNLTPRQLGLPYDRDRKFVLFFLRKSTVVLSDVNLIPMMFGRSLPTVGCSAEMMGDMFACAPAAVVQDVLEKEAAKKGLSPPIQWRTILSSGHQQHLRLYEQLRKTRLQAEVLRRWVDDAFEVFDFNFDMDNVEESMLDPCLVDLSQNPVQRQRISKHLMTLLQQSFIWSMKLKRPLLGQEHLVAQGVPVFEFESTTPSCSFRCPYASVIPELSQHALRSMAGNAICVPVIGTLLAFVFASTMPREDVQIGRQISNDCTEAPSTIKHHLLC
jgi:hypothetical protein